MPMYYKSKSSPKPRISVLLSSAKCSKAWAEKPPKLSRLRNVVTFEICNAHMCNAQNSLNWGRKARQERCLKGVLHFVWFPYLHGVLFNCGWTWFLSRLVQALCADGVWHLSSPERSLALGSDRQPGCCPTRNLAQSTGSMDTKHLPLKQGL